MTPEILLYHLRELGVGVALGEQSSELRLDAPAGALSPELVELVKSRKPEIIELVYDEEERAAI
ncbi:MAG TPA: hypothetical protein VF507_02940, partial [Pyrinomonadaceae bacterium]